MRENRSIEPVSLIAVCFPQIGSLMKRKRLISEGNGCFRQDSCIRMSQNQCHSFSHRNVKGENEIVGVRLSIAKIQIRRITVFFK